MAQLIYHFFNKNRSGLRTHVTFLMVLFTTIAHSFQTVTVGGRELPDRWSRVHRSASEKDIVKTQIVT